MTGKQAELWAKFILLIKGYWIINSNYITGKGTHAGEIDIIAKKGKTIVFIEVKKRSNLKNALHAISENQRQRILRGVVAYLKYHPQYKSYKKRIDGFFISSFFEFIHIKNAFRFK